MSHTDALQDHDSVGTVSKQGKSGVDESDANFVAMLENEADLVGELISTHLKVILRYMSHRTRYRYHRP